MQLLAVSLNVSMAWGITPDDPKTRPLDCLRGWSVVNPFLYKPIRRLQPEPDLLPGCQATFIADNRFHCSTNGFVLASTGANRNVVWDDQMLLEWQDRLMGLIRCFRYASKQFTLLPEIDTLKPFELSQLPGFILPFKGEPCSTPAWEITTAVTGEMISKVSQCDLTEPPPAYDTQLLDAMEAVTRQKNTTAVLLSETSIETLVRLRLEKAYKKAPKALEPNEIQNAKINKLLNELSQQLLGKSIYQEDPQLYNSVLTLYKRKNELVQTGGLHEKVDYAAIWAAMDAIQCAIQVFKWFGEPSSYTSPLDCNGSLSCNSSIDEL
jgi:hypothetical protein